MSKTSVTTVAETQLGTRIAQVVPCTEAEGPGRRFAVWFQGCPLRCPGCCNPEMLPFEGGRSVPIAELYEQLEAAVAQGIEGITLLGGEPFAHVPAPAALAARARRLGLTVMVFSGYTIEQIRAMPAPADELLALIDILVDGPYLRDLPETKRRWIGSANQRVHFLSERANSDDPRWLRANTIEIRLRDGEVHVNGFPATSAIGLWKRPGRIR